MISRWIGVVIVGLTAVGCGSDDEPTGSTQERFCNKWGECGFLTQGTTAQECANNISTCLTNLSSAEQTDWNNTINGCLQSFTTCDALRTCYKNNSVNIKC